MDIKRQELLANVAEMYYKLGQSQEHIAKKLGYSRSNISRLLKEGVEMGIVSISIEHPFKLDNDLQEQLNNEFNLNTVKVVNTKGMRENDTSNHVAQVAANHFENLLKPNDIVGVSWGRSLLKVANFLKEGSAPTITLAQIGGSSDASNPRIDGSGILTLFSQKTGAESKNLPAPLLADDIESAKVLLNQSSVREVFEIAAQSRIILVGIGSVSEKIKGNYVGRFSANDLESLSKKGVVGDICGFHYSLNGAIVNSEINKRVIALHPRYWKSIPFMIGITTGISKASAVLGALRGNLINGLIIDSNLAQEVLRLHTNDSGSY